MSSRQIQLGKHFASLRTSSSQSFPVALAACAAAREIFGMQIYAAAAQKVSPDYHANRSDSVNSELVILAVTYLNILTLTNSYVPIVDFNTYISTPLPSHMKSLGDARRTA